MSAAVPDHPAGLGVTAVGELDDVAQMPDRAALLLQCLHQRPAARDGLEAAGVAAPARKPLAAAVLLCPNSPAACTAPRCSTPPATMPAPSPLDALITSRSS